MDAPAERTPTATPPSRPASAPRFGGRLLLWMALTAGLYGVLWLTGFRQRELGLAIERGAAEAESHGIGETSDDLVRKAIRAQRETLPFWTAVVALGDFVGEPLLLALRAATVAVLFAALAALRGRRAGFDAAMAQCAALQGLWVLGLAVQVVLMVGLRRPSVETSAVLLLGRGAYSAWQWTALRQLDVFALAGWLAMAWQGWRRGQVGPVAALLTCAVLAVGEMGARVFVAVVIGGGIRLTVLPG